MNLNHVSAKMYGNMKYKELYFFRIYKRTIIYFDISKNNKTLSDNRVNLLHS